MIVLPTLRWTLRYRRTTHPTFNSLTHSSIDVGPTILLSLPCFLCSVPLLVTCSRQTRLTTQNLHHTCKLTTESYRNASIKSGTKKSRKGAIKGQTGVTAMNAYNADATLLSILGIDCKKILVVKLGGSSITIHQQQQQGGGVGAAHEAVNDEALEWFSETIRSTISKDFVSTAGCGVGDDDDDDNNGSNKYKRPNNKDRIAANDSDEFVNSEQNPAIIVVHGAAGSLFGLGHHSTAKRYGLEGKNSPPPDGMSLAPELVTGKKQSCRKCH